MKREGKGFAILFLIISMAVGVACGYSGRTPFMAADMEKGAEARVPDMASDTREESTPPEEEVEADAPEKPKKKYAKWRYNKKTHTLTIGGAKETHSEKLTHEGEGKFEWPSQWDKRGKKRDKVERIVIKEGVTSINSAAFARCPNVREIVLPDTIRTIRDYVFYECKSLEEVTLPDSVRSIGKECFMGCTSLRKIVFGRNVKRIGE